MRVFLGFCFCILFSISTANSASKDEIKRAQAQLNLLGYSVGTVDGYYGKITASALSAFWNDQNGQYGGTLTYKDLEKLNNVSAEIGYDINAIPYMDTHIKNSSLLKAKLPINPLVIKDYERLIDYRLNRYKNDYSWTGWVWQEKASDGRRLSKDVCFNKLLKFEMSTTPSPIAADLNKCHVAFLTYAVTDYLKARELYGKLFLAMAKAANDQWVYKPSNTKDNNPNYYNMPGIISTFFTFYAVNKGHFGYSLNEQLEVETFFKRKAFADSFDKDGDRRTKLCPILDPMKLNQEKYMVNNCGSVRLRFAAGELAMAIVTKDKALWQKGLWDLDFALSMINNEGFFVPLSAKGCFALGYTWDTSKLFSLNVEILKVANFNLLDYQTRHGKTISEAYEMLFKQYEDITISNHIAEKAIGSLGCGGKPHKTHQEFLLTEFGTKDDGSFNNEWVPTFDRYVNWSIRFISEKNPDWINVSDLKKIETDPFIGGYFTIHPFEFYYANVLSEQESIWHSSGLKNQSTSIVKNSDELKYFDKQDGVYFLQAEEVAISFGVNDISVREKNITNIVLGGEFSFFRDSSTFQEWIDVVIRLENDIIVNAKIGWMSNVVSKPPMNFFPRALRIAVGKCGKFDEFSANSIPIVVLSDDYAEIDLIKCYVNVFKDQLNDFDFNKLENLMLSSTKVLEEVLQSKLDLSLN